MPLERPQTVPSSGVPYPQRHISARADQHVRTGGAGWYETYGADGVVVARQGSNIPVPIRRIPEFDSKVGTTGREKGMSRRATIVKVHHCSRVTLDRPLQLTKIPVPYFDY